MWREIGTEDLKTHCWREVRNSLGPTKQCACCQALAVKVERVWKVESHESQKLNCDAFEKVGRMRGACE